MPGEAYLVMIAVGYIGLLAAIFYYEEMDRA